jgi:hypothetical protein
VHSLGLIGTLAWLQPAYTVILMRRSGTGGDEPGRHSVLSGCRRCVVAVAAGRSPALLDEFRMDLDVFSGDSTPEVQAALARGAKGPLFRYAEVGSESGRSADQMCGFCRLTGAVLAISFLCAPPKQLCGYWLKSAMLLTHMPAATPIWGHYYSTNSSAKFECRC